MRHVHVLVGSLRFFGRSAFLPRARATSAALCGVLSMVLVAGCNKSSAPSADAAAESSSKSAAQAGPLTIVASNAPLAYFAKRIGGDAVEVRQRAPEGIDPAFWEPSSEDIAAMQGADLILLNGAGFEKWRARVSLPERKVVETAEGFKANWIETKDGITHSHGTDGSHSHGGTAFTTWLDPGQAIEQARAIYTRLAELLPAQKDELLSAFQGVERDLRDLEGKLEIAVGNQHGLPLLYSHPIYDYLTRRFELNGKSLLWEPEAMPSDEEFAKLGELLKEHPAKWMVWEDEPGEAIRTKLRELGIECVVFAPASNLGDGWPRWLDRQFENAREFARVFE